MATITGDSSDEFILATGESCLIQANGGNDTVIGNNSYNDRIFGGAGNDSLVGDQRDRVHGGAGDDRMSATMGSPSLYGGLGNDVIEMNGSYFAGSGIAGAAYGGDGDDGILFTAPIGAHAEGGSGNDLLSVSTTGNFGYATGGHMDFAGGVFIGPGTLSLTFSGFERLFFQGYLGADTVIGGANDDTAYLYQGENVADMGAGNDTVAARYGWTQTLEGGAGDDLLFLMDALTSVYFIVDGLDGSVDDGQLSLISGFERYHILGGLQDDIISLGSGADTAFGDRGNDTLYGMGGDDSLSGMLGDDSLFGGDGADVLTGGFGNDVLHGDDGHDRLIAIRGSDVLFGGAGNDRLAFHDGGHTGWGGDGVDTFLWHKVGAEYEVLGDFTSGEDRLRFMRSALENAPDPGESIVLSQGSVQGDQAQFIVQSVGGQGLLFWDPDGNGATDAVLILVTANGALPTVGDLGFLG